MANAHQFNKNGFIHLKQVIPDNIIAAMQSECNGLLIKNVKQGSLVHDRGCIIEATHDIPNGLYLSSAYVEHRKRLKLNDNVSKYMVGSMIKKLLKELTQSPNMFLLNEQYIVKPSRSDNTAFVMHQDCHYLSQPNLYITVWISLDDISRQNGSIFMVPFDNGLNQKSWKIPSLLLPQDDIDQLQSDTSISSEKEAQSNTEEKSPTLESKMIELFPKVGDMVIFSSYTYHKSNCNVSNKIRRVIDFQYSTFPIVDRIKKKLARLVVKL